MKIRFKKKKVRRNLLLGAFLVLLGISGALLDDEGADWPDYGFMTIGILYIAHYIHDIKREYLILENGSIRKNRLYGSGMPVKLDEIIRIKKFSGEYELETKHKVLAIDKDLIQKDSLDKLNDTLAQLDLPPDKTPFSEK